ncbi:hypothetical protein RDI58_014797 [Solanum bulbocastanum]|uniref:Uncharacterized protein n=1 Tax=Solanum bulbocastanum TaxID=147425 RepID=A0AAN8TJA9_SOLBU
MNEEKEMKTLFTCGRKEYR